VTSRVSSSETPVVTRAGTPLTTPPNGARTSACTRLRQGFVGQASDAKLTVLADLLADLPGPQRREVIASLPIKDRAAIANLIAGGATG
jgi:hypothetical protein